MIRRPPRSTLFPLHDALPISNRPAEDPGDNQFGAIWVTEPAVIIRFTDPKHEFTLPPTKFAALTFSEKDRKSTRLNSSHANISYAVFCLKKKKKDTNSTRLHF